MVAPSNNLTVKLLPKQLEFIQSREKEVCYSGAFGAGKSRALCYWASVRAGIKGNVVGLCRKTRVSLTRTTLRTLLLPDPPFPPVLIPGTYEHRKSDSIIRLHGGGEIMYFGFDNPETVGSMNLGSCGIDEGIELDEDEYTMLLGRCRMHVDPYRQVVTATNPGSPTHFLYDRFFTHAQAGRRRVIQTSTLDNFFLPLDFREHMQTLTGVRYKRYVLGMWIAFEGLVYDMFTRENNVMVRSTKNLTDYRLVGFDEGYTNPAVLLYMAEDHDGRIHVLDEWYKTKKVHSQIVAKALQLNADEYIGDPSAAALISAMRDAGLNAHAGNNAVYDGIRAMQQRLTVASDGRARYTVDPKCTQHILEFESYMWDTKKGRDTDHVYDRPVKEMDHSMDSARYVVSSIDQDLITPSGPGHHAQTPEDEIDEIEEEVERYARIMNTKEAWN